MNRIAVSILLFLICGSVCAELVCNSIPTSFPESVQKVARSVVAVTVTYSPVEGADIISSASGLLVSTTGRVVTNDHVVRKFYDNESLNKENIKYEVTLSNCRKYLADLIFTNKSSGFVPDMALLKIREPLKGLVPASLEVRRPRQGDTVYAIGTPYGQMNTIVAGVVLSVEPRNGELMDSIHASTFVQNGNSGGGLVNASGNVIGLTYGCDGVTPDNEFFVCVRNGYFIPSVYVAKWVNFLESMP